MRVVPKDPVAIDRLCDLCQDPAFLAQASAGRIDGWIAAGRRKSVERFEGRTRTVSNPLRPMSAAETDDLLRTCVLRAYRRAVAENYWHAHGISHEEIHACRETIHTDAPAWPIFECADGPSITYRRLFAGTWRQFGTLAFSDCWEVTPWRAADVA